MDPVPLDTLAAAYAEFQHCPPRSPRREQLAWVGDRFVDLADRDPERCWDLILAVIDVDEEEPVLAALAAGPLEDLLAAQGDRFIARIEGRARCDAAFRRMLGHAWRNAVADAIWARVLAARDPAGGNAA